MLLEIKQPVYFNYLTVCDNIRVSKMTAERPTGILGGETVLVFIAEEGETYPGGAVSMRCLRRPDLMGYGRSPEEALDDLREALVAFKDGVVSMAERRKERLEDILAANDVWHISTPIIPPSPDPIIELLRMAYPEYPTLAQLIPSHVLTIPLSAQGSAEPRPYLTKADFFGPPL